MKIEVDGLMKLSCLKDNLSLGLSLACRVVSARPNMPILSGLKLSTDNGRLKIEATDLEMSTRIHVGAKVETDGQLVLPARLFNELVATIPTEKISLEQKTNDELLITTERLDSRLKTMRGEDFPAIPDLVGEPGFLVGAKELQRALTFVVYAPASDESRPVLAGLFFSIDDQKLEIVGTDSFRLSKYQLKLTNSSARRSFIIPVRAANELLRLISSPEREVEIEVFQIDNQIAFHFASVEFSCRSIEGAYPDYQAIIPKDQPIELALNRQDLIIDLKMASLFSRDLVPQVVIEYSTESPERLSLSGFSSEKGRTTVEIAAKSLKKSDQIKIKTSFNARFLVDALSVMRGETVVFGLSSAEAAATMREESEPNFLYLVMPLKIED